MSLINEVADLMTDVVVAVPIIRDGDGKITSRGTPITMKAHVRGGQNFSFVKEGKTVTASTTALVDGVYGLTVDFEYTLPADFSPRKPTAITVRRIRDDQGQDHEKVFFQ